MTRPGPRRCAGFEAAVDAHWAQGRQVVIVGGDHSISYGTLKAALRRSPELGILHLDAHADLRRAYEGVTSSHAPDHGSRQSAQPEHADHTGRPARSRQRRAERIASDDSIVAFFDEALVHQQFLGMPWAEQKRPSSRRSPRRSGSRSMSMRSTRAYVRTQAAVPGGLTYYQAVDLLDRPKVAGRFSAST